MLYFYIIGSLQDIVRVSLLVGSEQENLCLLQGKQCYAVWLADAQILLQKIKNGRQGSQK